MGCWSSGKRTRRARWPADSVKPGRTRGESVPARGPGVCYGAQTGPFPVTVIACTPARRGIGVAMPEAA